tara:strand:- start:1348 stop:2442 length:1095 start_codon:yes stop_codon:yes gene_type:complete
MSSVNVTPYAVASRAPSPRTSRAASPRASRAASPRTTPNTSRAVSPRGSRNISPRDTPFSSRNITPNTSRNTSRCQSPLRTELAQKHTFAASLNVSARPSLAPKPECPSHFYQLDLSTLRSKGGAVFGTENLTSRSDGETSSLSARSTSRAASEGATPRHLSLLGPDFDIPLRKHTFAASLKTSGRSDASTTPACPVAYYSGQDVPNDRMMGTFGKALTGRGLLVPLDSSPLLGPDDDLPLRKKSPACTFGSAPRPEGPMSMTRSGLAAVPPATPSYTPSPPGTAPRPTSMYLRRKSENQEKALTPAPPPPRGGKLAPMPPHRPLEAETDLVPLPPKPKSQRALFPEVIAAHTAMPMTPIMGAA